MATYKETVTEFKAKIKVAMDILEEREWMVADLEKLDERLEDAIRDVELGLAQMDMALKDAD